MKKLKSKKNNDSSENKNSKIFDLEEFMRTNIKGIAVAIISLVVVVTVIIVTVNLFGDKNIRNKENLEKRLGLLASDFYENKYYSKLSNSNGDVKTDQEKKEFAAKYKETGFTVDLASLARLQGDDQQKVLEEFKNETTGKTCNYEKTKVVIFPVEPYNIDSYKYEVFLDCGFEDE